jgi:TolB-like protein/DNA-binding winged helix-turn-helix (wHTH) protein
MPQHDNNLYAFGKFRLDPIEHALFQGNELVSLTPKALETLIVLVRRAGHVVSKEELMQEVWPDTFVEEGNLNVNISALRKALGEAGLAQVFIETVPRRGYRFVAPVELLPAERGELILERITRARIVTQEEGIQSAEEDGAEAGEHNLRARVLPGRRALHGLAMRLAVGVVLAVALGGYLVVRLKHSQAPPASNRVLLAVLPFANFKGDPEQEYLSDGLTEEMITELARLNPSQLGVIARTSVMPYKNSSKGTRQIANELGLNYIVEGSVIRSGARIRVTVQLIQANDQTHLWANEYDRDFKDILEVQGEIARAVAREIHLQLRPDTGSRPSQARATQPDAYEAYLKGRYFWWKRNGEAYQRAQAYFQQAIQLDPSYAPAYAGLADTYFGSPTGKLTAQRALDLDGSLAEAHTSLAFCLWRNDVDWVGAESHFRRALELDPYYPTAHHWYGYMLAFWGRADESIEQLRRAREMDPLNVVINTDYGQVLYWAGQFDPAIKQLKKALEIDSGFDWAHYWLGRAYEGKGLWESAIAEYELARDAPDSTMDKNTALGHLYARLEHREKALEVLRELERRGNSLPINRALIYAALGKNDRALNLLEEAERKDRAALVLAWIEPGFADLRSTQSFRDILAGVTPPRP